LLKSIIISGPPAIGKTTIAKGIAKEFDLVHLSGGDILKELAEEKGFDTKRDDWWDTQEGMNFLNKRQENSEFDRKVDDKLKKLFSEGDVVITSYTLPWLVDGGIKIWLDGSKENSAQRMTTRDNLSETNALEIVSAASIPDFMAKWIPFTLCPFINPAESPISIAPLIDSFGIEYQPPSGNDLAP